MRAAAFIILAWFLLASSAVTAAPEAKLWPRWQARDDSATARIDHGTWDRLLKQYVKTGPDGINRVAYGSFSNESRAALASYIQALEAVEISRYSAEEQFAYWANLYNALTVLVVLQHYPVRSIRDIDISPGLFSRGPWDKKLITVEGEALSLNDIEHRILRPIWRDPRVHYALNCASLGCPSLPAEAFTGACLDAQLEQAAREFVNHPRAVKVEEGRLRVSSIYSWFKDDFGGDDPALIQHLRRYARPELRAALHSVHRVNDHDYDWSLNTASPG